MRKILIGLSIVFCILTLIGAGYVIYHKGEVNAGYAVVPMMFTLIFSNACHLCNKKKL